MWSNYLIMIIVLLLAGCAGTSQNIDKDMQQPGVAAETAEPDMEAVIAALNDGKPNVAEALLHGLVQRNPQAAMPWVNLGLISFRRGELDRAQQAAERALELQPQTAVADYLLGLIAHQKNDAPQALKHYLATLGKDQQHAHTHYNLALLYDTYFQDIEKAVHHYRRYLELITDEDKATLAWLGELESQLGSGEVSE